MKFIHSFLLKSVASIAIALLTLGAARAQEATDHVIVSGDTIGVTVYDELDLEIKGTINPSGKVALKLVGELSLTGMSCQQAARAIEEAYKKGYLVHPKVTVALLGYAKRKVTIFGSVNKPGAFNFGASDTLTLLDAIGMAGGYSKGANPSKVTVTRNLKNGKTEAIKVDAEELAKGENAQPFVIQDGDKIFVDESAF